MLNMFSTSMFTEADVLPPVCTFLRIPRSKFHVDGLRSELRGCAPKVPAAGRANAAGLNHAAVVVNGLSAPHRHYLEGGGYGFIIGDGALNYGPEIVAEVYYTVRVADFISASAIYQPIVNPGFNKDRGPVHVFSGRVKVAF